MPGDHTHTCTHKSSTPQESPCSLAPSGWPRHASERPPTAVTGGEEINRLCMSFHEHWRFTHNHRVGGTNSGAVCRTDVVPTPSSNEPSTGPGLRCTCLLYEMCVWARCFAPHLLAKSDFHRLGPPPHVSTDLGLFVWSLLAHNAAATTRSPPPRSSHVATNMCGLDFAGRAVHIPLGLPPKKCPSPRPTPRPARDCRDASALA
jgi:hypothetical protein